MQTQNQSEKECLAKAVELKAAEFFGESELAQAEFTKHYLCNLLAAATSEDATQRQAIRTIVSQLIIEGELALINTTTEGQS